MRYHHKYLQSCLLRRKNASLQLFVKLTTLS